MPPSSPASVSPSVLQCHCDSLLWGGRRAPRPGRGAVDDARWDAAWGRAGGWVPCRCGLVPLGGWTRRQQGSCCPASSGPLSPAGFGLGLFLCSAAQQQLCPPLPLQPDVCPSLGGGEAGGCRAAGDYVKRAKPFDFPFPPRCAIQRGAQPCSPRASLPSAVGLAGVGERSPPSSLHPRGAGSCPPAQRDAPV